jgi:hypothetical protein
MYTIVPIKKTRLVTRKVTVKITKRQRRSTRELRRVLRPDHWDGRKEQRDGEIRDLLGSRSRYITIGYEVVRVDLVELLEEGKGEDYEMREVEVWTEEEEVVEEEREEQIVEEYLELDGEEVEWSSGELVTRKRGRDGDDEEGGTGGGGVGGVLGAGPLPVTCG